MGGRFGFFFRPSKKTLSIVKKNEKSGQKKAIVT